MAKSNKGLLLGGLAVLGLGYYFYSRPVVPSGVFPAEAAGPGLADPVLSYLQAYAASTNKPAYSIMVNSLNAAGLGVLYTIIHDYFATGTPLTPALADQWKAFTAQYGLT